MRFIYINLILWKATIWAESDSSENIKIRKNFKSRSIIPTKANIKKVHMVIGDKLNEYCLPSSSASKNSSAIPIDGLLSMAILSSTAIVSDILFWLQTFAPLTLPSD